MESSVQVAQRWILAVLRHHTFFSLSELNEAIREQLERLNARPMQKLGVSRRELYERVDRPALRPLPVERYELAQWKPCKVNIDYHIEVDGSHYSVPYQLIGEAVEVRTTASMVEVVFKEKRVASHRRRRKPRESSSPRLSTCLTLTVNTWSGTPSRLTQWASGNGPATGRLVTGDPQTPGTTPNKASV